VSTNRFINDGKNSWQRLENLLTLVDRSSLRRLHREEVRELGRIYRRTASDLAIARAESRDPRLISYLNALVIRAHGRIYQADAQGKQRIRNFFTTLFPVTFRRTWRYTALAFAVFWIFGIVGFVGTWHDPDASEFAGVTPGMRHTINAKEHWWESLNDGNQIGSSAIGTNNIQVTFNAFALGALFGIGTLYIMAFNGAMMGAIFALVYRADGQFGFEFLSFVVGHVVIELSCIFIAGAAGMLIGYALLVPGDLTRADALKKRGLEAVILIAGCVPILIVAAIIEGFISPAPINPIIKFTISILTGVALYSYLLLAGHGSESSEV
jgi:uncharacterized membrane protein SpoIIM required for sporulation